MFFLPRSFKRSRSFVSLYCSLGMIGCTGVLGDADLGDGGQGRLREALFEDAGEELCAQRGLSVIIRGSAGNDTLRGTSANECILGFGGNDTLYGGGGNDLLLGGDGDDSLRGDAGDDTVDGGRGNDTLLGGNGRDRLTGGPGDDRLEAGSGVGDELLGEAGDDTLLGGTGRQIMQGGDGNDQLSGNSGNDDMHGNAGDDTLRGDAGDDLLEGGPGQDNLDGGLGKDRVYGDAGDDRLFATAGRDSVYGGAGADYLETNNAPLLVWGDDCHDVINSGLARDKVRGLSGYDACDGLECEAMEGAASACTRNADCAVGQRCVLSHGLCVPATADVCEDNPLPTCVPTDPTDQSCDGIDDDCDTQIDEDCRPVNTVAAPEASITAGVAPLGVFFDASSTVGLADGNYLEADIRWDFGDGIAGNFGTTGKNKNQASGFVTGHVFERPGTYQVSASIIDVSGARLQTEPVTIVVAAFEGESRCLSSAGDFSQAPDGCDLQTSGDLASALSWVTGGSNRRLLLRRGERFSLTESVYLGSTGPTWVGSFGPLSEAAAGIDCNDLQQAVAFGGNDVRLVDLEIARGGLTLDGENQVALRIDVHDAPFVGLAIGGRQAFLSDSRVVKSGYFSIYAEGSRMSLTGNVVDQVRVATSFSRPAAESRDVYIANNEISASREAPSTGIKWHSRRGVITDNVLTAGISRIAITTDSGDELSWVDEDLGILLVERNIMRLSPNGSHPENDRWTDAGVAFNTHHDVVIRTNLLSNMSRAFVASSGGAEPMASHVRIYNNSISKQHAPGINYDEGDFLSMNAPPLDMQVFNNALLVDEATAYGMIRLAGNLLPSELSGLSMDHNVYFHTIGNLDRFLYADDASFGISYANWRSLGFDTHSLFSTPSFQSIDPDDASFLMLSDTSEAIDAGMAISVGYDYAGNARLSGAAVDIGAFERAAP